MQIKNYLVNFQKIVEDSTDNIYILDLDGNFLYANKSTLKFLGLEACEGKSIKDVASAYNLGSFLQRIELMRKGEKLSNVIIELPSKAMPLKHIEIIYDPVFDENNELIAVQGVARDITKRRQLEHDIFNIKNVLENIFDSITDEVFLLDRASKLVRANKAFLVSSGHKFFNEIIGKKLDDVYPEGKICDKNMLDLCFISGESQRCVQELKKTGSEKIKHVEVQYYPMFDDNGKVENVICYAKDISEKYIMESKIEDQNRKLIQLQKIENEMHGVLELNVLLKMILRGLEKFGFENSSLFLINEEEGTLEGIMSTSKTQDEMRTVAIPINKSNTVRSIVNNKIPISSNDAEKEEISKDLYMEEAVKTFIIIPLIVESNVIGMLKLTSANDFEISEENATMCQFFANDAAIAINRAVLYDKLNNFNKRLKLKVKEATTELMAKNLRLREASQMKTQLLSIISHELRTPLTSIKGYSSLFLNKKLGDLTDQQVECARIIDHESDKLKEVINQVINLSNLVSGKSHLILEESDLNELVREAVSEFDEDAKKKEVTIIFNEKRIPKIRVDVDKIKTLIRNLLSNAIKFNRIGGTVVISLADSEQFIQGSVRDTGIGIPHGDQEKVFEEFVQLEKHLTRMGTGTGIGLSMAREIVDLHTGDIWVESIPGKKTTFYFTLPKNINVITESKTEKDFKSVVEELESIRAVSSIIHKDFELDNILEIILQSIKNVIGFDRVRLYLTDKDNTVLRGVVAIGTENIKEISVPIKDNTVLYELFSSKNAKIYSHVANADLAGKLGQKHDTPFAAMPLVIRNKVIGVIVADNVVSSKKITVNSLESLTTFANSAAIAIENARLYNEMEIQIEERTEKLQSLNAKLNEFMNYLSHEIRTPLTSLIGYSKLLMSDQINEDNKKKSAEIIHQESVRLNMLIDDYLDMSKLEAGKMPVRKMKCNLRDLCSGIIDILRPFADKKGLDLTLVGESVYAEVDPALMKQALLNLVHNGIKFTNKGGVTLEVLEERDCLKILVIDTGIGIDPKDHEKVFDKFAQIHAVAEKGTGLGMPITKYIVEAHGGEIRLKSELGKGTKFYIILPKKKEPQSI